MDHTGLPADDLARLVAVEAITRLKHAYLRCLDTKRWDELAELLTDDVTCAYGGGAYTFTGRDAVMRFLVEAMGRTSMLTSHTVHHPEITLEGPDAARGTWALRDEVLDLEAGIRIRGAAFYDDRYRLLDGSWRIAHTGYRRLFEELEPRPPGVRLTASWWEDDGRSRLAPAPPADDGAEG